MDRELRELERAGGLEYRLARARIEGPGVLLEPLADRERWNATPEPIQDLALAEVDRRLEGFEMVGVRKWGCDCSISPTQEQLESINDLSFHIRESGLVRIPEFVDNQVFGAGSRLGVEYDSLDFKEHRMSDGSTRWLRDARISHRLATFRHRATGMDLQLIPGVACAECDDAARRQGRSAQQRMKAEHRCSNAIAPLLIGRWPVTYSEWWRGLSDPEGMGGNADLPRIGIEHARAERWCRVTRLRLPTAAEWDHAYRAGTTTSFYWGDEFDPSHCWYSGNSGVTCEDSLCIAQDCVLRPHPPREHDEAGKRNAFSLVDMIGNVWEWLADGQVAGGAYNSPAIDHIRPMDASLALPQEIGFRAAASIPGLSHG